MPLINCPECRSSVSDQARSCPQCGYPIRPTEYTQHSVITFGSDEVRGREQLNALLRDGWQIIDEDDSETWTTSDGYQCREYKYKLQR